MYECVCECVCVCDPRWYKYQSKKEGIYFHKIINKNGKFINYIILQRRVVCLVRCCNIAMCDISLALGCRNVDASVVLTEAVLRCSRGCSHNIL